MVNPQLVEYIKYMKSQGQSMDQLRSSLVKQGHPEQEVDEAINQTHQYQQHPAQQVSPQQTDQHMQQASQQQTNQNIQQAQRPQHTPGTTMGFFKKIKTVLLKPKDFFDAIKSEEGMIAPLKYIILFAVIIFAIQLTLQVVLSVASMGFNLLLLIPLLLILIAAPIAILMSILLVVVLAGIYHIIGKLFKFKNRFEETFKATAYGFTPVLIVMSFAMLPYYSKMLIFNITLGSIELNIFSIWAYGLVALGISKLQEVDFKKALVVVVIPIIVNILLSVVIWKTVVYSGLFF